MAPKTGDAAVEKPKDNKEPEAADKKEDKDKDKEAAAEDEELSEEDKLLKEDLELCVERLKENDAKLYSTALENMGRQVVQYSLTRIRSPVNTLSLTGLCFSSILKFLPKYYL